MIRIARPGKTLLKTDPFLQELLAYNDRANALVFSAAAPLRDDQLDQPIEMGRGNLRRTLIHIYAGESVWLSRMQGNQETPWLDESVPRSVADLQAELSANSRSRDEFLQHLTDADFAQKTAYRDSRGGLFRATLLEMFVQMCVHSTHHRAQAVNMLRRLGATPPEVDYMVMVRQ